ncbi:MULTISPECIES: DnaJ domain-containing protein [unclassified Synechococcus]|uniref:DnaJ domain-containing protein n=1 Tax=unclassified Synechococcus TaxID=2626047 RepID=UPI002000F321|nr:DnaJ domain-containing protein [Synechococcus sp. A10-1-5-1]UPM50552.1 DnaJ domain-containing protein [Synechococcus sp. A10-1-5-1]
MSETGSINHWAVLGLDPGADASSLKRAFRQQARRWHPDLNGDDPHAEEQFKAVNEAYAVLSDPQRRQQWEASLDESVAAAAGLDPFATGFPDFEDYLDVVFHRERRRSPRHVSDDGFIPQEPEPFEEDSSPAGGVTPPVPPPPPPVVASEELESLVELTPEQALEGVRVELELPDGTAIEVWTPAMAGDGWRLRLAGVAPGGRDHFLQLRVRTDAGLRIDGLRVHYQLELSPAEGALGCTAVVPTLDGPVQLRIPPGSSSGRLLRLRSRGLSHREQRGDQLVEIRLVVPQGLSEAEEALYRRLQQLAEEIDGGRDGVINQ